MDKDRSLRQRLQSTVLEPDPLGNSALRQTNVPWIDLVQNLCLAVFVADFVLHLALVERPRRYLFSFTGLIDASAVLFFRAAGAQ